MHGSCIDCEQPVLIIDKSINIMCQFRYDRPMSVSNPLFTLYLLKKLACSAKIQHTIAPALDIHHIAIIEHLSQTRLFDPSDFSIAIPPFSLSLSIEVPVIRYSDFDTPSWQRADHTAYVPHSLIALNQLRHSVTEGNYTRFSQSLLRSFPEHLKPLLFEKINHGSSLYELMRLCPDRYSDHELEVATIIAGQSVPESHFLHNCRHQLWQLHQCMYFATQPSLTKCVKIFDPIILSSQGHQTLKALNGHMAHPLPQKPETYQHPVHLPDPFKPHPFPQTLSPSALLTYQECPFRFLAKHILRISAPLTEESLYFSQFGEFMHHIWATHTRPTETHIKEEIQRHPYFQTLPSHLQQALTAHIEAIAKEWQMIDDQRPSFTTIGKEFPLSYTYANITLQGRIDRIDEIDEHTHLIIDYKSTKPSLNWYQDTLHQLPIYAIMYGKKSLGIAYAQLKKNQCHLSGHISEHIDHSPLTCINQLSSRYAITSWDQATKQWEQQLHHLIDEMISHDLPPKPNKAVCPDCEFKPLCRMHLENQ